MQIQTFYGVGTGPSHSLWLPSGKRRIDFLKKVRAGDNADAGCWIYEGAGCSIYYYDE